MGFLKKTKLVTTFHGYDVNPWYIKNYKIDYTSVFKKADLLTVNTEYTKELLKRLTDKNVRILPVGLDTNTFVNTENKKAQIFTLLFVGRLIQLKATDMAVEIFNNLKNRGYTQHGTRNCWRGRNEGQD